MMNKSATVLVALFAFPHRITSRYSHTSDENSILRSFDIEAHVARSRVTDRAKVRSVRTSALIPAGVPSCAA